MASKLSLFLAELKRRKVYRVATVYVVVGAGIIGLADAALPSWEQLQVPVVVLILIGFPISLVLAWAYEVKPEEPRSAEENERGTPPPAETARPIEVAATEQRKSIVVLPFDNMSPDPGDAYFADGLTEEVITDLSYLQSLRVISRNSAMVLKESPKSTRAIAEELEVQYVLEGSVRKAGEEIRITAQLIDAATDEHLWAERYGGTLDEVFKIQEDVSQAIVDALQLKFGAGEERSSTKSSAAHDLYLRGLFSTNSMTEAGLEKALEYFSRALEEDPEYALAYSGMARAHGLRADIFAPPAEAYSRSREAAMQALEIDSNLAEARSWLATVLLICDRDYAGAEEELRKALKSNPNLPDTVLLYAFFLFTSGRITEALSQIDQAFELDPYSPLSCWMREGCYLAARDYERLIEEHRKTVELHPDFFYWDSWGAVAYRETRRYQEALTEYGRLAAHIGDYPFHGLAITHVRTGETEKAKQILEQLLEMSRDTYVPPDQIAMVYLALGDLDAGFEWLDQAYEKRSAGMMWLGAFPEYDTVRSDPRFVSLTERLNYSKRSRTNA